MYWLNFFPEWFPSDSCSGSSFRAAVLVAARAYAARVTYTDTYKQVHCLRPAWPSVSAPPQYTIRFFRDMLVSAPSLRSSSPLRLCFFRIPPPLHHRFPRLLRSRASRHRPRTICMQLQLPIKKMSFKNRLHRHRHHQHPRPGRRRRAKGSTMRMVSRYTQRKSTPSSCASSSEI